ncbi:MAG: hypothetical protein RIS35_1146 [Pseudomonadota bacterium]
MFGYGSLIWNPEFEHDQSVPGRLHGYHRAFCIGSVHYRGTPEAPGVVLGLDRGGSCAGVAFHLREARRRESLERLYAREMLGGVYRPVVATVTLRDARQVRALAFVADRACRDYLRLDEAEILRRLRACAGSRGRNRDYALETWRALGNHGIRDGRLARLCRSLMSDASEDPPRQPPVDPPLPIR